MNIIICILGLTATALAGDEGLSALKLGNDKFTAKMLYEVATLHDNVGKNVVISAFSVIPPLAQLALASVGESHDELLNAIGLPNDDTTKVVFTKVNREISLVKGVELNMASRIYVANDAKLNQQFAEISHDVFNSDVKNIDFSVPETAAAEINAWVEDHTNNKIKNLVDKSALNEGTRVVLVNAIYFKGIWKHKFDAQRTVQGPFQVTENKTVQVPMMSLEKDFPYAESDELDAKILEMPYVGDETSFVIILPNKVDGIKELQEKLKDASLLEKAMSSLQKYYVSVKMPKFKIETTTDLGEVLPKINIKKLFSMEARLENLLSEKDSNVFISSAIQKAFIEVNEDGAEATAANDFNALGSSYLPSRNFEVDKPFYFEIKHKNTPIFNGLVLEP